MQQTETLKLNIIEPADTVDPEPINQNMVALETETQAIRQSFPINHFAVGSYAGNGGTQTIELDFTPRAVLSVCQRMDITDGRICGLAVTGGDGTQSGTTSVLTIAENGFTVYHGTSASVNSTSNKYNYIALG